MENELQIRPTSGTSPDRIATQLANVRHRTLALVHDLTDAEFMGPMLPIVNPILWEIGHVGWFHEFWTLRHLEHRPPLIAGADKLWDSSNVAHDTRWDLDLPSRSDVLAYLSRVLDDQLDRLHSGIDDAASQQRDQCRSLQQGARQRLDLLDENRGRRARLNARQPTITSWDWLMRTCTAKL